MRYPQYQSRFQNRVNLVGDIAHNDGAIMLQRVKESDEGNYTCSIHLGSLMFRKTLVLHVIQEEPQTTSRPELLGGHHVVIIVGIVCATLLLLTALILIVKKTHRNKSSGSSTALMRSMEDTKKANVETHIYSSVTTWEVTEEEASGKPDTTYMIMHPVQPSLRSHPNNLPGKKTVWEIPQTD